jgi:hypothetical protein
MRSKRSLQRDTTLRLSSPNRIDVELAVAKCVEHR